MIFKREKKLFLVLTKWSQNYELFKCNAINFYIDMRAKSKYFRFSSPESYLTNTLEINPETRTRNIPLVEGIETEVFAAILL